MSFPTIGTRGRALDFIPAGAAKDVAAELESLGYGAVWLPELAGRDVFVHMALLLGATECLVVGSSVATIWARDAVAMSSAARTLEEAFPARVLVGIGAGHKNLVEELRGHDYKRPLRAMRSYLAAMDEAPFTANRPARRPRRLIGALGPKMLRLAVERADGACPYLTTPAHTAMARDVLGRESLLCVDLMCVLERDGRRAREVARRRLAPYLDQPHYAASLERQGFTEADVRDGGSDRLVDALVAAGSPDDVLTRVREHLDAGADHVAVQPLTAERRGVPLREWRELAPALTTLPPLTPKEW